MAKVFREVLSFGLVGAIGFCTDTLLLYALKSALGLMHARLLSFAAAVLVTWLLNRTLTFRERKSGMSRHRELAAYALLMLAGGAVNYGLYAWMIFTSQFVLVYPIMGIAAGSLAGMMVNLASSRFLLFRFDLHD